MSFDTDSVPNSLSFWLEQNGIIEAKPKAEPEPVVERNYEFRMPQLDENGEPPF
jgi:hypothetical protein